MFIIGITIVCCIFIAIQLTEGIDDMMNNHPNYKGKDLFELGEDDYIG